MSVSITVDGGKLTVRSPFHPDWPPAARDLGGDWRGGVWVFDARDKARVRELAREVYGSDGSPDPAGTVTVRIPVDDVSGERGGRPATLYRLGRLIASRYGRDDKPRLGEGVVLVSGGWLGSAGSHNYIQLGPQEGTIVEVRGVPRIRLSGESDVEIVSADQEPDEAALRAERERLVARISEIDAVLGNGIG